MNCILHRNVTAGVISLEPEFILPSKLDFYNKW